ncbi:MAG: hypothetical protein M5E90_08470 [Asgard group archaeon]|nr:hypothetical protein [Asgard group archaeon]
MFSKSRAGFNSPRLFRSVFRSRNRITCSIILLVINLLLLLMVVLSVAPDDDDIKDGGGGPYG